MSEITDKESPFEVGEVVWVKGIDLRMVVSMYQGNGHLPSGYVECMWTNNANELQKHDFPLAMLTRKVPNLAVAVTTEHRGLGLPYVPSPINLPPRPNQENRLNCGGMKTVRDPKTGEISLVETPDGRKAQPLITPKGEKHGQPH